MEKDMCNGPFTPKYFTWDGYRTGWVLIQYYVAFTHQMQK